MSAGDDQDDHGFPANSNDDDGDGDDDVDDADVDDDDDERGQLNRGRVDQFEIDEYFVPGNVNKTLPITHCNEENDDDDDADADADDADDEI